MKRFCVIGIGNFGYYVARALFENRHEVTAIDVSQEKVQNIKDHSSAAIQGDAASKDFLVSQGIQDMDAVIVATGQRSHMSTLITLFLKELEVKRILVKSVNDDHSRILKKVGATDIIQPEKDMAYKTARALSFSNILDFIPLAEEYSITEVAPPRHFIGKDLITLNLRQKYQVTVIAVKDVLDEKFLPAPPPDYVIKDSDLIILIGQTEDVEKALKG
ncbi:MAG: TrkA family potassium uptake protein [Pseudomonadota bacterium]